jgi:hypothetical protein
LDKRKIIYSKISPDGINKTTLRLGEKFIEQEADYD